MRRLLVACACAVVAAPVPANAQATATDRSAADALFTEAREFLDAGRTAEACLKLEESLRLDPAAGTALNLGDCYERINRTASAYTAFGDAATLARRDGDNARADEANRRADALQPKLVRLTVNVPKSSRLQGLEVTRDGKPLTISLWGTPVAVDPGEHVVEAKAPGHLPWKATVQLAAPGTVQEVTVPVLGVSAVPLPPSGMSGQRIAGIVVGGLGVATLGVSAGLAVVAAQTDAKSKEHCLLDDPNKCYTRGVALRHDAIAYANASTIVAIAGGLTVATGVTLFLLGKASKEPDKPAHAWVLVPQASPYGAGLTFGATF